jgi:hypothetical protein
MCVAGTSKVAPLTGRAPRNPTRDHHLHPSRLNFVDCFRPAATGARLRSYPLPLPRPSRIGCSRARTPYGRGRCGTREPLADCEPRTVQRGGITEEHVREVAPSIRESSSNDSCATSSVASISPRSCASGMIPTSRILTRLPSFAPMSQAERATCYLTYRPPY